MCGVRKKKVTFHSSLFSNLSTFNARKDTRVTCIYILLISDADEFVFWMMREDVLKARRFS